jgi:hypothetical protein
MSRLNQRAFEILKAEILRCTINDIAGQVQRDIALRRLERFQAQTGAPLTLEEMRDAIVDLFPDFSEKVLKAAARANFDSMAANAKTLSPSQIRQLRTIADTLETVKPNTTVYSKAQAMLKAANNRLQ